MTDNPFRYFAGLYGRENILSLAPITAKFDPRSYLAAAKQEHVLGKAPAYTWESGLYGGITGWERYRASEADLDGWFAEGNNVGLRLDDTLLAIDGDCSDPAVSAEVEAKTIELLGASPKRVGRANGFLLLYRTPERLRVSSVQFQQGGGAEKIEVFTGSGKQVAVYGGHRTAKGGKYTWPRRPVPRAELSLVTQEQFDTWFAAMRALLPNAQRVKTTAAGERKEVSQEKLRCPEEWLDHLRDALSDLPNNRTIYPDRTDYISMGIAMKAAFPDLDEAFEHWTAWAAKDEGGTPENWEKDWRGMKPPFVLGHDFLFSECVKHGKFKRTALHYDPVSDDVEAEPIFPDATAAPADARPTLRAGRVTLDDLANLPPRQWLYGHKVLRKYVTFVASPGGVGKTAWVFAMALACAAKRPLLHDEPRGTRPLRVWLFNLEDDITELKRRLVAALAHYDLPPETLDNIRINSGRDRGVKIVKLGPNGDYVVQPDYEGLVSEIEREQIDIAIFDPFLRTHGVPENENEAQDEVMRLFAQVAERTGCGIVLVHHTKKGAIAGDLDSMRGGSTQGGGARAAFTLAPMQVEEAARLGISDAERRLYVRVDDAKNNMAPPVAKAEWLRLVGYKLGNPSEDYPAGDSVQVVTKWAPPDAWDGIMGAGESAILARLAAGMENGERYSARAQDKDRWAGALLADEFERTPQQAKEILETWLREGRIVVKDYTSPGQRKMRRGIFLPDTSSSPNSSVFD